MNEKIYGIDGVNFDNLGKENISDDLGYSRSNLMKKKLVIV
jgi:hypothetical protein